MPTTVEDAFKVLLDRQQLTPTQKQIADTRIAGLKSFFATNFSMAQTVFLTGSYGRGTICRGQRDIDLMAPLSYPAYKARYDNDPQGFLYFVRNELNERYWSTKVSSKKVAVTLDFTDISVDVVPCFVRRGDGYLMPDGKGGWMSTNPAYHNTFFAQINKDHNLNFKRLVRLVKAWNLANGNHLRSFHIEVILQAMWKGHTIGSWPAAVAATLSVMGSYIEQPKYDPWNSTIRVDEYLSRRVWSNAIGALSQSERAVVVRMLNQDAVAAKKAEEYRKAGKMAHAFERWGVVYRQTFPAFG